MICTHWKKEKEERKKVHWIKAIWYSLGVELKLYSNENETQVHGTKWEPFQHIMLSGRNQMQRSTCWMILFRQNSRAGKADSWCDPSGEWLPYSRRKHKKFLGFWWWPVLLIWVLITKSWLVCDLHQIAYLWLVYFLNFSYIGIGSLLEKILERYHSLWGKLPEWEFRFSNGNCSRGFPEQEWEGGEEGRSYDFIRILHSLSLSYLQCKVLTWISCGKLTGMGWEDSMGLEISIACPRADAKKAGRPGLFQSMRWGDPLGYQNYLNKINVFLEFMLLSFLS